MPNWHDKLRIKWNKTLESLKSKKVVVCKGLLYENIPCKKLTIKPFEYCKYHFKLLKLECKAYHFSDNFAHLSPELHKIVALTEHQQRIHYENK